MRYLDEIQYINELRPKKPRSGVGFRYILAQNEEIKWK